MMQRLALYRAQQQLWFLQDCAVGQAQYQWLLNDLGTFNTAHCLLPSI
jgi:hypothetical protein